MDWAKVLGNAVPLHDLELKTLSQEAKQQVSFHVLLSSVLSSPIPVKDIDTKKLSALPVPQYLQPDKTSFILEIKILAGEGKQRENEIAALLKIEPGLQWRMQAAQDGEADWLGYKKKAQVADSHRLEVKDYDATREHRAWAEN